MFIEKIKNFVKTNALVVGLSTVVILLSLILVASAQEQVCYTPDVVHTELANQGFELKETLSSEDVAKIKENLLKIDPTLTLTFDAVEVMDDANVTDEFVYIVTYENGCMQNFFASTVEALQQLRTTGVVSE